LKQAWLLVQDGEEENHMELQMNSHNALKVPFIAALLLGCLSLKASANPDLYTGYLINKPVDYLTFGVSRANQSFGDQIEAIKDTAVSDGRLTRKDVINLYGWIDYIFGEDKFIFTTEVLEDELLKPAVCEEVWSSLSNSGFFLSFPAHFLPHGFTNTDMPTGLANKILEKSYFSCGGNTFAIPARVNY
jgi:hypothetical protein